MYRKNFYKKNEKKVLTKCWRYGSITKLSREASESEDERDEPEESPEEKSKDEKSDEDIENWTTTKKVQSSVNPEGFGNGRAWA